MSYEMLDPKFNRNISRVMRANKNFSKEDIDNRFNKFFRLGYIDTHNNLTGARDYLFFTKPNLYLFDNPPQVEGRSNNVSVKDLHLGIQRHSPKLCSLYYEVPHLFYQLSRSVRFNNAFCGNFIPLLTNTIDSSLDLPGVESQYSELTKTTNGAMRSIRGNSFQSNNEFTFSLEFIDNKYLEIYKLAMIYDEYMNLKSSGLIDIVKYPTTSDTECYDNMLNDLLYNIDSDLFTIYKITVSDDGESILHYAKLWGVSISNVPRDAISNLSSTDGKLSIPLEFKAEHVADLDPMIIADFNKIGEVYKIGNSLPNYAKIWDESISAVSGELVGTPFITDRDEYGNKYGSGFGHNPYLYKLKFTSL